MHGWLILVASLVSDGAVSCRHKSRMCLAAPRHPPSTLRPCPTFLKYPYLIVNFIYFPQTYRATQFSEFIGNDFESSSVVAAPWDEEVAKQEAARASTRCVMVARERVSKRREARV